MVECCGRCAEIEGGGRDCTCDGNPKCEPGRQSLRDRADRGEQTAEDVYALLREYELLSLGRKRKA